MLMLKKQHSALLLLDVNTRILMAPFYQELFHVNFKVSLGCFFKEDLNVRYALNETNCSVFCNVCKVCRRKENIYVLEYQGATRPSF